MIPLHHTSCSNTADFLERAIGVAEFYGFDPIASTVGRKPLDARRATKVTSRNICFTRREERTLLPIINTCGRRGLGIAPTLFWRNGPIVRSGSSRFVSLELHVTGVRSAVAEALLINVTNAIADEVGVSERVIGINSIGSDDSSARYVRDLGTYLRKNTSVIPETFAGRINSDPVGVLLQLAEKKHPVVERAPQSMEFLNEEERQHFWGVLEYLESTGTFYELNPYVLGSRDCWTHTLFEMNAIDSGSREFTPFARGGRYDSLINRSMSGSSGACMHILSEIRGRSKPRTMDPSQRTPKIYVAHLGIEAKRQCLSILEALRRAQILVRQSLTYEQIAGQIAEAKRLGVPHMLIIGHKEAVEGTVLVRDMSTNSQIEVPTDQVVPYLKRHRIGA